MRKRKAFLLILVFALSILFLSAPVFAAKTKINKKSVKLTEGDTVQLQVTGAKKKVKWSSSNKKVAKVNKNGVVVAKKKGKATIKAKVGKKTYKCKVTVVKTIDAWSAYKQFMGENYNKWTSSGAYKMHYTTYDIDKDGTDELFVSPAPGARGTILVYCFDGKSVIQLGGANAVHLRQDDNLVLLEGQSMTEMSYDAYKKVGNVFIKQYSLNEYYGNTWKLNGNTITEKEFNSYINAFNFHPQYSTFVP